MATSTDTLRTSSPQQRFGQMPSKFTLPSAYNPLNFGFLYVICIVLLMPLPDIPRWAVALGDRSFSTYLLHWLFVHWALLACGSLPRDRAPYLVRFVAYPCGTMTVAYIVSGYAYRFIELPAIALGARVLHRMFRHDGIDDWPKVSRVVY